MAVIKDPPAINFLVVNQAAGISPAAVLTDQDGNLLGTATNPLVTTGGGGGGGNASVGSTGVLAPAAATNIGGVGPTGLLTAPRVTGAAPLAADPGLVVRAVGTVEVSAPGGGALALDATLTSGAMLAQVTGTGTAGAPAVGVATVQGILGGFPIPVSGTVTAANASVGLNGAAIPTSSTQVGGTDGVNLRPWGVDAAGAGLIRATSLPLPTGAAADATLTGGTQTTRITDGTNTAAVKAASVAAVATDPALVVAISPNNTVAVTGTVTITPSGTQTVAGNLTNNNAAPAATHVGALVAVANAAAQTWTEGREVLESVDLSGAQRVTGGQTPTATLSSVAASAASVSLLASNTSRKGVIIVNDGNKTLYVKYGAAASLTSYSVLMPPNAYWEMPWPIYTGAIDGIWNAANGSARITEL